jgi:hypothetical protein
MNDKDKSVIEKFKDTVSEVVETMASAMTPTAEQKRKKVAASTNEQVYIPEATDAAAMPPPLFAAPRKRKTRTKAKPAARAKKVAKKTKSTGRKAAAKKRPAKKVAKKRKSKR